MWDLDTTLIAIDALFTFAQSQRFNCLQASCGAPSRQARSQPVGDLVDDQVVLKGAITVGLREWLISVGVEVYSMTYSSGGPDGSACVRF